MQQERSLLLQNKQMLEVEDHGAGSRMAGKRSGRTIASIARQAVISAEQGALLFRLVQWGKYYRILELGTSLGLSAAYMAGVDHRVRIDTIEGSPSIAAQAAGLFRRLGTERIRLHTGIFDEVLPRILTPDAKFDLVYIDGNHRYEPTLRYMEMIRPHLSDKSVVVLDDIHWSREMHQAWKEVKNQESFPYAADLYYKGLLFREPGLHVRQSVRLAMSH